MTRFSPRFLKVFLRLPPAPSFFSGVTPSGAGSAFAINQHLQSTYGQRRARGARSATHPLRVLRFLRCTSCSLNRLLLRDGALARSLARARVRLRALPADGQGAPMAHPAVAADLHQPLDVHRDFLAEITLDPALLLDDPADL